MTTHVVATAGHVDHGKSTLVRALTGMEPDRWEEERRRGLTIDLGFAWTTLPSGREVAFVDVPGHGRFIRNALAGLATVPVVCFVVAADEGWSAQSSDHRDAIAALGIRYGLIVVTKADRAPDLVAATIERARSELAHTGLHDAPAVAVSAMQNTGLDQLKETLDDVLAKAPAPDADGRLRMWIDRSFSVSGAGTVVTGTLVAGTLTKDDGLVVVGQGREPREVAIRALESRDASADAIRPMNRAAVNLRGVAAGDVSRGQALIAPCAWFMSTAMDVRRIGGVALNEVPAQLTVHIGTAAVPARLRSFDAEHARVTVDWPLPLIVGDRLLLRDPASRIVLGGVGVLDPDPPQLVRRGDGTRRGAALAIMPPEGDVLAKVASRGAVEVSYLRHINLLDNDAIPPPEVRELNGWWVHLPSYDEWRQRLRALVEKDDQRDQLTPGVSQGAVREALGTSAAHFIDQLIADAGLEQHNGYVRLPRARADLGRAEAGVAKLEARLLADPFLAPLAGDLVALGLGVRELAAAERARRVFRLQGGVVLLPSAPDLAIQALAQLPQPFTTSQARQALGTSRRVAIPLLEYLDGRGRTRRIDDEHREVVR
ncbi:selenocysteine-specific translation elongation factor [Afipia felis]|uniref:SelB translation factor n=2 Tax=Afipia felis TaxID=1035 RepID=A0A380WE49_AFIFE|nr:selenocysteine-specific translation elongation factor [Afipia felis]EKS29653.1 selenocysteine-specific translation elongation factor [Afipia felis ATCC 53690]SUU78360.1 SelB translation factor [Afipia felis]SUU86425.1 SelB translation factor [Afipia felis]